MSVRFVAGEPQDWERVARLVAEAREALSMSQAEAVATSNGGISSAVWSILENARQQNGRMGRRQVRAASTVLGWTADSIERILDGGEPMPGQGTAHRGEAVPVGFARRWSELSSEEQAKVEAYMDGLFDARDE